MRTIDAAVRPAYLSGTVTPKITGTVRRLRLDFGGMPLVYNTYNVITAGVYSSDDYYGALLWGDSCVTATSSYLVRLINSRAWAGGHNNFASKTNSGSVPDDWVYADITNCATSQMSGTRLGIYPKPASDNLYVWYVAASDGAVYREELATATWVWSSKTATGLPLTGTAHAIHPVAADRAFVVSYNAPHIQVRLAYWNGVDWTSSGSYAQVWMTNDLDSSTIFYSDAELLSGTTYCIVVNLAQTGAAYAILYDTVNAIYSQPTLICGGSADWTGYRVRPTGLSSYNARLWLACERELEASNETPQAYHVALMSSANGKNWREEGFVGIHACRGKLIYGAGTYCFVAGNAAVYRAAASYKLGADPGDLKQTLTEATGWQLAVSGANASARLAVELKDDDYVWSASQLLEAGNEVSASISHASEAWSDLFTAYLVDVERIRTYTTDGFKLTAGGPLSKLAGPLAWCQPAGKLYQGPQSFYSNFNLDSGSARFTVAQQTGTWSTERDTTLCRYILKGQDGIAIIPRSIASQWLTMVAHLKLKVSVEGAFIVFFYEDADNYWRAGIWRDGAQDKLIIERITDGVASRVEANTSVSTDMVFTLYVDARPGMIRVYLDTDDDFSLGSETVNYPTSTETVGYPLPFHVGLEVLGFRDYTGANKSGTVDSATTNTLTDAGEFDGADVGQYCRVTTGGEDYWRKVIAATADTITLQTDWSTVPSPGDEWGLYDEEDSNGPYVEFRDVGYCDCLPAWTVDDLVDDVLETSGVGRDSAPISIGTISGSSPIVQDVDVRITNAAPSVILHASRPDASYTAYVVSCDGTWVTLSHVLNGGAPSVIAKIPCLVSVAAIATTEIRVIYDVDEGVICVYADDHCIGAFWNVGTGGSGYVAVGAGTGTTTEYSNVRPSFIWDVAEPGNTALANLLRGRRAKLVERADGAIAISDFDTRDDLGTWATSLIQLETGLTAAASLIELEGADVRAYYLEPSLARYNLLYARSTSESISGETETLSEARRIADLSEEVATYATPVAYAPDPAVECEDEVTIGGTDYIVEGYALMLQSDADRVSARMQARVRKKKAPYYAEGAWGAGTWGQFRWG